MRDQILQGGYNIAPLVDCLDKPELAETAAEQLSHTLLMFDAFFDVEGKAKAGNSAAKKVTRLIVKCYFVSCGAQC